MRVIAGFGVEAMGAARSFEAANSLAPRLIQSAHLSFRLRQSPMHRPHREIRPFHRQDSPSPESILPLHSSIPPFPLSIPPSNLSIPSPNTSIHSSNGSIS